MFRYLLSIDIVSVANYFDKNYKNNEIL